MDYSGILGGIGGRFNSVDATHNIILTLTIDINDLYT
jgi:hypothetical protein